VIYQKKKKRLNKGRNKIYILGLRHIKKKAVLIFIYVYMSSIYIYIDIYLWVSERFERGKNCNVLLLEFLVVMMIRLLGAIYSAGEIERDWVHAWS